MARYYVVFFFAVLTIPPLLWVNAWQSTECGKIKKDIKTIERMQETQLSENKTISSEIVDLLSTERLEAEAKNMGLKKVLPENVILVIMGGKGRDL